jgi:hypothetical protein
VTYRVHSSLQVMLVKLAKVDIGTFLVVPAFIALDVNVSLTRVRDHEDVRAATRATPPREDFPTILPHSIQLTPPRASSLAFLVCTHTFAASTGTQHSLEHLHVFCRYDPERPLPKHHH